MLAAGTFCRCADLTTMRRDEYVFFRENVTNQPDNTSGAHQIDRHDDRAAHLCLMSLIDLFRSMTAKRSTCTSSQLADHL